VIGVLALQGNFDAHIKVIKKLNLFREENQQQLQSYLKKMTI